MIDISEHPILLCLPQNGTIPFDPDRLQKDIADVLSRIPEWNRTGIARDIVCAVEFSIRKQQPPLESGAPYLIQESFLCAMVASMLENIGCQRGAELYRSRYEKPETGPSETDYAAIRLFMKKNMQVPPGTDLDNAARQTAEALSKLHADDAPVSLIQELARYYLDRQVSGLHVILPSNADSVLNNHGQFVDFADYLPDLPDYVRALHASGILKVHRIDLRIFPAIRIEVRLMPVMQGRGLTGPLTELSIAPACFPLADAIDEVCVRADRCCAEKGIQLHSPLKLMIHFADAREFARTYLVCSPDEPIETDLRGIAGLFRSLLGRKPCKFTCP